MKRIIFPHQGKTGGTSLVHALTELLGQENSLHDTDQNDEQGASPKYRNLETTMDPKRDYSDRSRFTFIHGHFDPRKYRTTFPDALYITFYRDPMEQFVSLYYYWRRTPLKDRNPYRLEMLEKDMDLIAFADMTLEQDTMERWVRAFAINGFGFVGITEEYDASINVLRAKHLPRLPAIISPKNINPEKSINAKYELDDDTRDYLLSKLSPKMQVYQSAKKRLEREIEELGTSSRLT